MLQKHGIIERSLSGYPGKISAILSIDSEKDAVLLKQKLLQDNPMLTALYFHDVVWEKCKELVEWGKKNGLGIGLSAEKLSFDEIKSVIESGSVDFMRFNIDKKTLEAKKKVGLVRGSGIKHEFVYNFRDGNVKKLEEMYKFVSPCDSFVVEVNSKLNNKTRDYLLDMASRYKSLFLRKD